MPISFFQKYIWNQKNLLRFFVGFSVVLSLVAGYYQLQWSQSEKKYNQLEDKYVRVRAQLGVEATQQLIDQSYQKQ